MEFTVSVENTDEEMALFRAALADPRLSHIEERRWEAVVILIAWRHDHAHTGGRRVAAMAFATEDAEAAVESAHAAADGTPRA